MSENKENKNKRQTDMKESKTVDTQNQNIPDSGHSLFNPSDFFKEIFAESYKELLKPNKERATLISTDRARIVVIDDKAGVSTTIEIPVNVKFKILVPELLNHLGILNKSTKLLLETDDGFLAIDDEDTLKTVGIERIHNFRLVNYDKIILAKNSDEILTPEYLIGTLYPYLSAIDNIQKFITKLKNGKQGGIKIKSIEQHSPISVSLDGAAEAIELVKETIVPWKRRHTETMANLLEQEKLIALELTKAEVLEKRASANKIRAESDKLKAEIQKQQAETERLKLENAKLRFELQNEKILLIQNLLNKVSPNLTEVEKISNLIDILPSFDALISSNIEITD